MRIELLGTVFHLETDQDPEYLADCVDYLRTKLQEVESSITTSDPLKLAILAALLAIDELFQERSRRGATGSSKIETEIETLTRRMIDTIDAGLGYIDNDSGAP